MSDNLNIFKKEMIKIKDEILAEVHNLSSQVAELREVISKKEKENTPVLLSEREKVLLGLLEGLIYI